MTEKRKKLKSVVSVIVEKDAQGKINVMEKFRMYPDGKKELTFMAKERVNYLKSKNNYNNYLKQFDRIEGKDIN